MKYEYEGGMTADYADYGDLRRMGFGVWIAIFMENKFIKTLNKNLRSSAGSTLSAGETSLFIVHNPSFSH